MMHKSTEIQLINILEKKPMWRKEIISKGFTSIDYFYKILRQNNYPIRKFSPSASNSNKRIKESIFFTENNKKRAFDMIIQKYPVYSIPQKKYDLMMTLGLKDELMEKILSITSLVKENNMLRNKIEVLEKQLNGKMKL